MPSLTISLAESLENQTFLRLVLSQPIVSAASKSTSKISVRSILLKEGMRFQWTSKIGSQEHHENLVIDEFRSRVDALFCYEFTDAHLFTTKADLSFRQQRNGEVRSKRTKPSLKAAADLSHNREKNYLIPVGVPCPFLIEIGVMLSDGQIRSSMYHKFRQINRYLEFVNDVLPDLPPDGTLNIVDFGCGKSYLTFALHHLLTSIHGRSVSMVGLDLKEDVISDCNRIAQKLNCQGLHFEVGRIESFRPPHHVHLAVSLHACDTATDDALAGAIRWQSEVILAVPCCQHELNRLLDANVLPGLNEYGILRERFASLATDALRARFLDWHGYRTQILEFISMEHTPKNLLIRAIRRLTFDDADRVTTKEAYDQMKADLVITSWHLENQFRLEPS